MTNDKADFTQGNILKKLVAFMIPVLGALILQAAYGAVDLLVVGRFGSTSGSHVILEKKDRSRLAPLSVGLRSSLP